VATNASSSARQNSDISAQTDCAASVGLSMGSILSRKCVAKMSGIQLQSAAGQFRMSLDKGSVLRAYENMYFGLCIGTRASAFSFGV
jgi:hypothetical protein